MAAGQANQEKMNLTRRSRGLSRRAGSCDHLRLASKRPVHNQTKHYPHSVTHVLLPRPLLAADRNSRYFERKTAAHSRMARGQCSLPSTLLLNLERKLSGRPRPSGQPPSRLSSPCLLIARCSRATTASTTGRHYRPCRPFVNRGDYLILHRGAHHGLTKAMSPRIETRTDDAARTAMSRSYRHLCSRYWSSPVGSPGA